MEKVHRELGRYPKWYKAEKDETEKGGQPRAGAMAAKCDTISASGREECVWNLKRLGA